MADFSFFSDSDDDKKVEDLLSQAMDQSVLEQVSAINCSGFTDSVLPTQLETRFTKLKSFPAAKPMSQIPPMRPLSPRFEAELKKKNPTQSNELASSEMSFKPKSQSGVLDLNEELSDFSIESAGKLSKKSKSRTRSLQSPSNSRNSSRDSPSPPRAIGCFWCSPKRGSSRKNREYKVDHHGIKNEEFSSDLSNFSTKGQEKLLKRMMKEEEKINREAAKIVEWVKQASARMELSDLEDEISDNESTK